MIANEIDRRAYRPRIDVNDYFELRSWAKRFGVTAGDVRRAVARVGDVPKDVETYLDFARANAASELRDDVSR
jgi:Protein of unknown function (DUF3606)